VETAKKKPPGTSDTIASHNAGASEKLGSLWGTTHEKRTVLAAGAKKKAPKNLSWGRKRSGEVKNQPSTVFTSNRWVIESNWVGTSGPRNLGSKKRQVIVRQRGGTSP